MRFERIQGKLQTLRDLLSEVQENHTDIQRLWKQVEDGQLIWPVGIAAAPPIEEMSSSSRSSSSASSSTSSASGFVPCDGCDIPVTLTAILSGTWEPTPGDVQTYPYDGTYILTFQSSDLWESECTVPTGDPAVRGIAKYTCGTGGGSSVLDLHNSSDCSDTFATITFTRESFTCDPFHWVGTLTGGAANLDLTFEITE